MYEIFSELMEKMKITPYKVSKETGISYSSLSEWKAGRSTPKADKLKRLAEYFGVSVEFLMTGEERDGMEGYYLNEETREIAQEIFMNKEMRTLFDMSRKMPPERLRAYIEFIKKMNDSESE